MSWIGARTVLQLSCARRCCTVGVSRMGMKIYGAGYGREFVIVASRNVNFCDRRLKGQNGW